ncbi:zinc metalloprotease [Tateyamaria omphalii]|uniref:RIP metalloprotease RseP n=1 Tax=Tateyamaria omphalii TaxID=299262 RepID=UPI001673B48A|nr:RIP metalloprotease RseP [Tateyamaria omphalii]GGX46394.1 zinc metalloprotease [Tateyamaria omphalii]
MDISALIPAFGGFAWTIFFFVVALSVIVAIHEYGHYIVGRWSGIHADVFSIGFGPVLWSRMDKRGTRWQIAALPFGGYVKFAGDANAASGKDVDAMDEAAADPVALRRTMHGAPLWARAATVSAGPVFNFVLSILVFAAVIFFSGVPRDPLTVGEINPLPDGVYELREGDVVREIEGLTVPSINSEDYVDFVEAIPEKSQLEYLVDRDGDVMTVTGPYLFPPLVTRVVPRSAGLAAGFEAGDVITSINGAPVFRFGQLPDVIENSDGAPVQLTVWRAGAELEIELSPKLVDEPDGQGGFEKNWRIGLGGGQAFEMGREAPSVLQALSGGYDRMIGVITGSINGLGHLVTGAISSCNLSGPIGIAQVAGTTASHSLSDFIWFIAVLSTAVGLLNLFPIPALDGGHLVFYVYEAVTGKPPSDGALRILMTVGLTLVLSLMLFALGNDIFCP